MSFWSHSAADDVYDFDDYDPTPYSGGYDIGLTYGYPLDPDAETCYPISDDYTEVYFDYESMQYSADAEPNAYAGDGSYSRPAESYEGEAIEEEEEGVDESYDGGMKHGDDESDEDGDDMEKRRYKHNYYREEYDEE